jgi:hypothetical protein
VSRLQYRHSDSQSFSAGLAQVANTEMNTDAIPIPA